MIQKLKHRFEHRRNPPGMYESECMKVGCTNMQSGLVGGPAHADYCQDCADWMERRADLVNRVMHGDLAAYHAAKCPHGCIDHRPILIPEKWSEPPDFDVDCPECGEPCVHGEVKRFEVDLDER